MAKFIDLTGKKFGRLTVIRRDQNYYTPIGKPVATWLCRCECGQEVVVFGHNLRDGTTQSCGCIRQKKARPPKTAPVQSHFKPPKRPTIQDTLIIGETYTIGKRRLKCIGIYSEFARFEDEAGHTTGNCYRFWDLEREIRHD